ncbi:MAG: hypothetical protein ACO1G2_04930 [Bacteroidota bacterium]
MLGSQLKFNSRTCEVVLRGQRGLLNLKIEELAKDGAILEHARNAVINILNDDPLLNSEENKIFYRHLHQL